MKIVFKMKIMLLVVIPSFIIVPSVLHARFEGMPPLPPKRFFHETPFWKPMPTMPPKDMHEPPDQKEINKRALSEPVSSWIRTAERLEKTDYPFSEEQKAELAEIENQIDFVKNSRSWDQEVENTLRNIFEFVENNEERMHVAKMTLDVAKKLGRHKKTIERMAGRLQAVRQKTAPPNSNLNGLFSGIQNKIDEALSVYEQIDALIKEGNPEEAGEILFEELEPAVMEASDSFRKISEAKSVMRFIVDFERHLPEALNGMPEAESILNDIGEKLTAVKSFLESGDFDPEEIPFYIDDLEELRFELENFSKEENRL